MGIVWKAYDTVLRRYVALKLLSSHFRKTKEMQERFLREARAAGAIQHPNIVTVYDLGEAEGQLFIAMELVEGRDLSDVITLREPMALERKLDLVIEVLDGLQFAHQRGVIHRDVKPSNVRVVPDGRVKIMDFGIARCSPARTATRRRSSERRRTWRPSNHQRRHHARDRRILRGVHAVRVVVLSEAVRGRIGTRRAVSGADDGAEAAAHRGTVHSSGARAGGREGDEQGAQERYESAAQMQSTLIAIRAALSGAGDETTSVWASAGRPCRAVLKLVTQAR